MNKMQILDFLGMAKDGEVDNEAAQRSMKLMAEQAAKMSQFEAPNMQLMQQPNPMAGIDPRSVMREGEMNPYAPVNYMDPRSVVREGEMGSPVMREGQMNMMQQYAPQNMSMQQIMTMLKRAGY
jgi:ethanolamine utilization protein EutQ (cupin superfamily)